MLKILAVVEDDPKFRTLLRLALREDERLQIEGEVSTAEDALEHARAAQPDLVILDHILEGARTGLDVAPAIKSVSPGSKILLFTAFDVRLEAERSPAIDAFLRKQEVGRLLVVVRELLNL